MAKAMGIGSENKDKDMFFLPGTSYLCAPNGVLYKNEDRNTPNEILLKDLSTYDFSPLSPESYNNWPSPEPGPKPQ